MFNNEPTPEVSPRRCAGGCCQVPGILLTAVQFALSHCLSRASLAALLFSTVTATNESVIYNYLCAAPRALSAPSPLAPVV